MTAPAVFRPIPTPGDLAHRRPPAPRPVQPAPAPQAAEEQAPPAKPWANTEDAIAPGKLTKKEHFRKYFLFGLRYSRMPAHARLVGHDLMWRASHATGQISPSLQPTREQLALATGLTTGQVDVALQVLSSRGWLHSRRLKEGPRAGQPAYRLAIPAVTLEQVRALGSRARSAGFSR